MSTESSLPSDTQQDAVRLDKWLKIARIYKTRALASRACEEGRVKVNDQRAKASKMIHVGDRITVRHKSKYRTFDVLIVTEKNVSKKDAAQLYKEHAPQLSEGTQDLLSYLQELDRAGRRKYKGRPTKKERRQLEKFLQQKSKSGDVD
jgi:ribosome-associated heat shock protein Hsp15